MKTYTREQLMEILELHRKWIRNEEGGKRANLSDADLSGAYLRGAYLRGANLSGANLSGANLSGANLSDANLSDANLSGANLSGANLSGANLSGANLSGAYLRGANLSGANLSGAYLRGANLSGAYLRDADLSDAKEDLYKILDSAPNEVEGVLKALQEGRVNGSTYSGECACLVGTIANIRNCDYRELAVIEPNSDRPAERWFMAIRTGDTPENHPITKITAEWVQEYLDNRPKATEPTEQPSA
jgi:hypothetical protein